MNYKYIEQLLERYWECQTTLEEEAILRSFFAQADIPASLLPYRDLFQTEEAMAEMRLDEDFDRRLMARLMPKEKESRQSVTLPGRISLGQRLNPFFRAAAMVAVVLAIGMAAQQGFERAGEERTAMAEEVARSTEEADTIRLFAEPQLLQQTEAVLVPQAADSLGRIRPN